LVVAALVAAGSVGVAFGAHLRQGGSEAAPTALSQPTGVAPSSPQVLPTPSASSAGSSLSVEQIAAKVDPAIVDIYTTLTGGEAAGTGMILTSDGLVLTNNHVIADSTDIRVQVDGTGTIYKADVLGYDTTADVALLKLENASGLTVVPVGDPSALAVGDAVVALGNALGRGGTPAVASGAVTGLDQQITVSDETGQNTETLSGLIEVDANLLPGDSGGPLVNTAGQVVGMDTAASAASRRTSSGGYAIRIDTALAIVRQIQAGTASAQVHIGARALLGVEVQDGASGAVVATVQAGSPAESAGLSSGDTIVGVDSKPVSDGASLRSALDPYHPGDRVSISWVDAGGVSHHAAATLVTGPPA
jgi:S1-C subfamily serine protease